MFKKIPYGVKVRVRGNEKDGFIAEYAICTTRFLPFLDNWTVIKRWVKSANNGYTYPADTFPTFELAKEAAMGEYHRWIGHFKRAEEEKKVVKAQRKIVWKHP